MLIQCHECKKEISSQAAACPKCGAPVVPNLNTVVDERFVKRNVALFFSAIATVIAVVFIWPSTKYVIAAMSSEAPISKQGMDSINHKICFYAKEGVFGEYQRRFLNDPSSDFGKLFSEIRADLLFRSPADSRHIQTVQRARNESLRRTKTAMLGEWSTSNCTWQGFDNGIRVTLKLTSSGDYNERKAVQFLLVHRDLLGKQDIKTIKRAATEVTACPEGDNNSCISWSEYFLTKYPE